MGRTKNSEAPGFNPAGLSDWNCSYVGNLQRHPISTFRRISNTGPSTGFSENKKKQRLKVVLDGQQRLQSLYISLYGNYQGKYLYFDVLSGRASDDFEEEKYCFEFMKDDEAEKRNKNTRELISGEEKDEPGYFVKVSDLFSKSASQKVELRKEITKQLNLPDEKDQLLEIRLEINIAKFDEVLTKDENVLKALIIDENKPQDSPERQTDSDVLEIFFRINRQGIPLDRSDLIFSMMKLNWKESATAMPDFVKEINQGNSFELNIDFVIRALFAVSDLGTKFDVDLLRKKSNMETVRSSFQECCKAIQSTIDYVQQYCWVSSSKTLGGDANLIPFVYYFFHCPKGQLPNSEIENFRKMLFLFGFSRPFSRYADSRLGGFIRNELSPRLKEGDYTFPIERTISWINYWEGVDGWGKKLVQGNPRLASCMIQQQTGTKAHRALNKQEMDHIFPRSKLRAKFD